MHFQEFWDSCAQKKTSEISKNVLSGIMGILCAEQHVENIKKCMFINSGILARSIQRRKSSKIEDPGFVEPLLRASLPVAGRNSQKLKVLDF